MRHGVGVHDRRERPLHLRAHRCGVARDGGQTCVGAGLEAGHPPVEAVAAATEVGVPVRTSGGDQLLAVTAEDAYGILLRFEGGGLGVVSLVATARHSRATSSSSTAKRAVRLDADRRVWWGRDGEELRCEGPLDDSGATAFKRVARNFWAAIRNDAPPDPSLEEALRTPMRYVLANWKMYPTIEQARAVLAGVQAGLVDQLAAGSRLPRVIVCPPVTHRWRQG